MYIIYFFLFFFFKQKTAYEIKECDWSSDVCSSDLGFISRRSSRCSRKSNRSVCWTAGKRFSIPPPTSRRRVSAPTYFRRISRSPARSRKNSVSGCRSSSSLPPRRSGCRNPSASHRRKSDGQNPPHRPVDQGSAEAGGVLPELVRHEGSRAERGKAGRDLFVRRPHQPRDPAGARPAGRHLSLRLRGRERRGGDAARNRSRRDERRRGAPARRPLRRRIHPRSGRNARRSIAGLESVATPNERHFANRSFFISKHENKSLYRNPVPARRSRGGARR